MEGVGSILEAGSAARTKHGPLRIPHFAFRTHEPLARASPDLLQLPRVRLFAVAQAQVPIERWRPEARALRPFDEDDRALTHHVVEPEVTGLVGDREPIAVHVIYRRVGGVVMVPQRVGRTGG